LEGLFELVLNIVRIAAATSQARIILPRIVGELHERGVIAGAAAAGEARIILRLPRVVGELLVIADAAAASEARVILARIVGELLVIADVAATGEARTVLSRIVGVGADNTAECLTFSDVELVARTYDDCPRAKLARS